MEPEVPKGNLRTNVSETQGGLFSHGKQQLYIEHMSCSGFQHVTW